ncbi:BAG family molecular chaperone regulator 5, mitochondrial [Salvia hispanica]|uniref:BAG family molecular chaperone regulator 5, mitochondrial n=1 Tax=Salvia hispanica TaxID=49212 RepID=UPI0020099937|nr:BAG family molecular chaperone regulator 5, mitochondrial [Salvia hispanica]
MKSSSRTHRFFSSTAAATATTVVYSTKNDSSAPEPDSTITGIPIAPSQPTSQPIPITVHLPPHPQSAAAVKIQAAFRSHVVRSLVRKISAINYEANHWQKLIQRQETVDAVRSSALEKIKINEALMGLLFRLDAVPGLDPNVRELRRHVSRKIVGLQEILDAVSDSRVEQWDGHLREWDEIVAGLEQEACKDVGGGHEMERFCAENLGFQCLQRFLRDQ